MKNTIKLSLFILSLSCLSAHSAYSMNQSRSEKITVQDNVRRLTQTISNFENNGNISANTVIDTVPNVYFDRLKPSLYTSRFEKIYSESVRHVSGDKKFFDDLNSLFNIKLTKLSQNQKDWTKILEDRKKDYLPLKEIHRGKVAKSLGLISACFAGCTAAIYYSPLHIKDKLKLIAASSAVLAPAYYLTPKAYYGYEMFKEGKNHFTHLNNKVDQINKNMQISRAGMQEYGPYAGFQKNLLIAQRMQAKATGQSITL